MDAIVIEKLDGWVIPKIINRLLVYHKRKIFYFDSTIVGLFLSNLFLLFKCSRPRKLEFQFDDLFDENNSKLGWSVLYTDLSKFLELVKNDKNYLQKIKDLIDDQYFLSYLNKSISSSGSTGDEYKKSDTLLHLFKIRIIASIFPNDVSITYFLEKIYWKDQLSKYAENFRIELIYIKYINKKYFINFIRNKIKFILCKIIYRKYIQNYDPILHPKVIAIDTVINRYQPERIWNKIKGGAKSIVFIMHSHIISKKRKDQIIYSGSELVSSDSINMAKRLDIPIHLYKINKTINKQGNSKHVHQHVENVYHNYQKRKIFWNSLFNNYGCKIFISSHIYNPDHISANAAIDELDGISIMFQEPYHEFSSPEGLIHTDKYFCHSPSIAQVQLLNHSMIKYCISVGYIGNLKFNTAKDNAIIIKTKLKSHGAKVIISFLDENTVDDSRWGPGHEQIRKDYQFLCEKLLEIKWLGLVLKPKKPSSLKRRLGKVSELLDKAISTGRCYIFSEDYIMNPCDAAYASDIAIHDSLVAGTAGMECALAGIPTLLLDRDGWQRSQLYKLGLGKVIFHDLDSLWDTLNDHWNNKPIPGLGDWSPIINDLDPFRDGKASQRMTTYLSWLIEGFKQNLDRKVIMDDAADRYAKKWGNNKIITNIGYS